MNAGSYGEAVATFEKLNGFKDSQQLILQCRHRQAVEIWEHPQDAGEETGDVQVLHEKHVVWFAEDPLFGGKAQICSCAVYTLNDGHTFFDLEFMAENGIEAELYARDDTQYTAVTKEAATAELQHLYASVTSQQLETHQFSVQFRSDTEELGSAFFDFHTRVLEQTDGKLDFASQNMVYSATDNVHVFSFTKQLLDNGYVRYTVDFRAPAGRMISVFNPPDGDAFMFIRTEETTGSRETLVFDIEQSLVNSADDMSIKFFSSGNTPEEEAYIFAILYHSY